MDLECVDELLTTTRTVRRRLDLTRPVPREVLLDCVRLSQQAPNGANLEGWRWVIVTDPEIRAKLADIYRRGGDEYLQTSVSRMARTRDERSEAMYEEAKRFAERLQAIPALVVPCIKGRLEDTGNAMACSFYGSIFPAVWSFMLAARSRGLGTSFTTAHLHKESEAAELLGIPANVSQVALVPTAYFTGDTFRSGPRRPVESIVHWDHWSRRA